MILLLKFAVAAAIVMIGAAYAKRFKNKAHFFEDLYIFLLSYCDCLQFYRNDLIQFVDGQTESHGEIFGNFLNSCKLRMQDEEKNIEFPKGIKIDGECKVIVGQFFENLGKSDAASELNKCVEYKHIFQRYKEESEKESKKNYPLYVRLSIYGAILFLILFL